MVTVSDDGTTTLFYRSTVGTWISSATKDTTPPDPEPGEGGWHHPLGKQTPWTTYEDGGGSHSAGAVDFGLGYGTEAQLFAPCDGTVIRAGWEDNFGGNVIIVQPDGESTGVVMAHLNRVDVALGAKVKGGAKIGLTGWTGAVIPEGPAGAHLHLEVRRNGVQWGPWFRAVDYFAEKGITL